MPALSASPDGRERRRLVIGEWSVEAATNELRRGGDAVRVEPKAMDVLMLLAERAGSVVSRDELFAAVWPGVVVGDEALTQSIIKLRRALGDDPRAPAYIETISKRGYRLIAPVRQVESAQRHSAVPELILPTQSSPGVGRATRAALLAGLLLAAGGAALHYFSPSPGAPAVSDLPEAADVRAAAWVTVVPFEALGPDSDQTAYLALGISDNLMTDLSRLSALRVIRDAGTTRTLAGGQAARYRIAGSVQRDLETLRINVHLADTRTNEQLWAGRFERPFGDLFVVQDEIIAHLVEVLPGQVSDVERRRLAKRHTRSLDAYDQFLRGQALFLVRRDEENEQARVFYRKALELDPKFARAYASLAMTYALEFRLRPTSTPSPALDRAFELAETARLIDPDIPEVYWALGFVHAQGRRHEQAIASLQQSIQIDRSFADGYALLAGIHTYVGQPAKSIPLLRTAMRLNPDGGYLYFLVLGRAYLFEGDYEQSILNLREALLRNPVDVETRALLAASLAATSDEPAARWEADEIRSLRPGFAARDWLDTYPMTDPRQREWLLALLVSVGL